MEELRIVLIGKTGSGKSAAGNFILGEEVFQSKLSPKGVTRKCQAQTCERNGRNITIVDTPGLFDTSLSYSAVSKEIRKCMDLSSPGPHVFLFVIRIGRFTQVDAETVHSYAEYFGDQIMNFTIFIFTGLDNLERESVSFQQYINEAPPFLQNILRKYKYIAIDCISADDICSEKLLETILTLVHENKAQYYRNDQCKTSFIEDKKLHPVGNVLEERMNRIVKSFHDLTNKQKQINTSTWQRSNEQQQKIRAIEAVLNDHIGKRTRSRNKIVETILNDNKIVELFELSEVEKEHILFDICGKENMRNKRKTLEDKSREHSQTRSMIVKRTRQADLN